MKVLVTGSKGQLAFDVLKFLKMKNIQCKGVDIEDFDLTNEEKTINYIKDYKPESVIHCAAYTAVDNAENEKDICFNINVNGTKNIAKACSLIDSKLIYISTDYVFDGKGDRPFSEDDEKNPVNYYGYTKAMGEKEVIKLIKKFYIIRISWAFGINGNNFVKSIVKNAKEKDVLNVVNDQFGSPTYTKDLAELLYEMVNAEKYGIYHASNSGYCNWYEFALEIINKLDINCKINPVKSKEYKTIAIRPFNSRLKKDKLSENGFKPLRDWKVALESFIGEMIKDTY